MGAATHAVSTLASGADTANPMSPPACRMATAPSEGAGVPLAMCTRPSTPRLSADQPMTTRPVSELRSGWRRYRQDSSAASTGVSQAADPAAPCTKPETDRPTGLPIRHQMLATSTIAMASQSSPTPSRRCSGSRSRALRPNRRAVKPTVPATTIHAAARAWPIHWIRIRMGSRVLGRAGGRRPLGVGRFLPLRGLRLAADVPRRADLDPDAERAWLGRLVVLALRRAGLSGSARAFSELPSRGRV